MGQEMRAAVKALEQVCPQVPIGGCTKAYWLDFNLPGIKRWNKLLVRMGVVAISRTT